MNDKPDENQGGLDESLQREINEALGGGSIEELYGESDLPMPSATPLDGQGEVRPDQVRRGRVIDVDSRAALVDLGGKDQGLVPLEQFEEEPAVGDELELMVIRYNRSDDLWVLSREGAVERTSWDSLHEGQIVEAFVEKTNKGGLEVKFSGIGAFMPVSQISLYRVEDPEEFVGSKLRCQVVEADRHDKRVIVSARAVMELEAQQKREKLLAELAEGDEREGVVRQVMPFGAFVDLGGIDGLVHVSQMSHERVEDPADFVKPGQTVQVKVLKMDAETGRISLGMKQVQPDPWDNVENKYPTGLAVAGQITRLENFGAFCRLEPGLEGLIPISEISWTQRLRHPSDVLAVGQEVQVAVLKVEPERRRISLSFKQAQANPWAGASLRYESQSEYPGLVSRITEFGAFVELEPGVEALAHISELSDGQIRRVEDVVQIDQTVRVRVLSVDEQARRISVTMKGVSQDSESSAAAADVPTPAKKKRKKSLRGGLD